MSPTPHANSAPEPQIQATPPPSARAGLDRVRKLRGLRNLRAGAVGADGQVSFGPARRGLKRGKGPPGLWILSPLAVLALLYIATSRWVAQSVDVEGLARGQIIPALERQLGQRIEVGRIESDLSGLTPRVTIRDIVIGRSRRWPLGALFQARSATLSLDAWAILARRSTPIAAIRDVHLEAPQVDLERGANGRWNLLDMASPAPQSSGARPAFSWSIANGRLLLADRTRIRGGKYLQADARALDATGRVNGARPLDFQSTAQVLVAPARAPIALRAWGEVDADAKWALADVDAANLPLPALALWGLEEDAARDITLRSGVARIQARLGYDAAQPPARQLLAQGQARLQDASLAIRGRANSANSSAGDLEIEGAQAALSFNNSTLDVRSASARVLNTPLQARGALSWKAPSTYGSAADIVRSLALDVRVQSPAWDVERLRAWLPPDVRQQLSSSGLQAGRSWSGGVRVRGRADDARLSGVLQMPSGGARGGARGAAWNVAWQAARADFDVRARGRGGLLRSLRGRVEVSTPSLRARSNSDAAQASGLRNLVQFAWRDVSGTSRSGAWNLSATGSTVGQSVSGRSAGAQFASASSRAVWSVAAASASSRFELSQLRWSGSLRAEGKAARAQLAASKTPTRAGAQAQSEAQAGAWALRVDAPSVGGLSGPRVALWARDWSASGGGASVGGQSVHGDIGASVAGRASEIAAGGALRSGSGSAPTLRLAARGLEARDERWGRARLRDFSVQLASLGASGPSAGGANGLEKLARALGNWPLQKWRGAVSWRQADADEVRWARVSPSLAALQSAGRVDGAVSFPALDGAALKRALDANGGKSDPQVLVRSLLQLGRGARGEVRVRDAAFDGVPIRQSSVRWSLGENAGRDGASGASDALGALRFASSLDAATLQAALDSPRLRSRLGRDAGLLDVARGLSASASASLVSVRGALDVGRLARGDWRRAGAFEIATPLLLIDAARLNPWLASARGRQISDSLSGGVGRLRSVSGVARARLSIRSRPNALDAPGVAWEISLPRAQLQAALAPDASVAQVQVANLQVRGGGTLRLSPSTASSGLGVARFEGAATASAARLALSTAQSNRGAQSIVASLNGASLQNARATAQFAFDINGGSSAGASAPIWKAQLRIGRARVPLPAALRAASGASGGAASAVEAVEVEAVQLALDSAGRGDSLAIVPRLSVRLAGGRADGSLRLGRDGGLSAQLLASNLDAALLARGARAAGLGGADASSTWGVSGRAWASVKVEGKWPRFNISTQARYLDGRVRTAPAGVWPIDLARLSLSLPVDASRVDWARLDPEDARTWRGLGDVRISEATLWSQGARAAFTGQISRQNTPVSTKQSWRRALSIRGRAVLNELPLRQAERVPALRAIWRDADIEGALSAAFDISGALARPRASGNASLRLASALGLRADGIEAFSNTAGATPIEVALDVENPLASRLEIVGVRGRIENAPFSGSLLLDGAANRWTLRAQTRELPSARLLQGASRLPASTSTPIGDSPDAARARAALSRLRQSPLRGGVTADVSLVGTLFDAGGKISPRPSSGSAAIETGELRWRGRNVGSLSADVALDNRVLQIAGIQLFRSESRARDLVRDIARDIANGSGTSNATAIAGTDAPASRASLLRLTGAVPLDSDAPGLELRLVSEDTALPVVLSGADELLRFLQNTDAAGDASTAGDELIDAGTLATIIRARRGLALLPGRVRGRVALDASISGTLASPQISVPRLVLRDAAFVTTEGEQILPTIDTAFRYDGPERAVIIDKAQVLLAASPTDPVDDPLKLDEAPKEQTVLQLDEGGRLELDGIVNIAGELRGADVALLSRYVPSLRVLQEQSGARGRIDEVRFKAQGAIDAPTISGSVLARGLALRDNTLDRLEVRAFRIGDGAFTIGRGDLMLQKGAFLSRSASVEIPWTWGGDGQSIGPRREAAIRISLPVANEDFGALAGVLIPTLQRADAKSFSGLVELGGTIEEPKLSGDVLISGGRFRVAPRSLPFDVGLEDVSGHLLFSEGNHLIIDAANTLRGRVVAADRISAPKTGNVINAERAKSGRTLPPTLPADAARALEASDPISGDKAKDTANSADAKRLGDAKGTAGTTKAPELSGSFSVGGGVVFDLSPEVLARPLETLGSHFYDLSFSLDRAQAGEALGGLRDISLGARWKTQGAQAASGQVVSWMALARGVGASSRVSFLDRLRGRKPKAASSEGGGAVLSLGALRLRSDFSSGVESLARSEALPPGEAETLQSLPVQAQVRDYLRASGRRLEELLLEPPQLRFERLRLSQRGLGRGTLDGALSLDNAAGEVPNAPRTATRRAQVGASGAWHMANFAAENFAGLGGAPWAERDLRPLPIADFRRVLGLQVLAGSPFTQQQVTRRGSIHRAPGFVLLNAYPGEAAARPQAAPEAQFQTALFQNLLRPIQFAPPPAPSAPSRALRVRGSVTVEDAELSGVPASSEGGVSKVEWPGAPLLDVTVALGRSVRVVSPNLRTEVGGTLSISGTPREPFARGTFETRSGSVRFPGANARILNGRVEVAVGRDPETRQLRPVVTLDVSARGQVGSDTITLSLRGPLDLSQGTRSAITALGGAGAPDAGDLRVDITSSRGLSQDEAFAQLLGTSRRGASGEALSSGQTNRAYAQAVVSLVSAPLFSGLERTLEDILGLSSLTLEYRFNEPSAIQIGKAIGSRVYVTYRRTIGGSRFVANSSVGLAQRGDSLRVEYRLKGGVQAVYQISRDQIGSFADTVGEQGAGTSRRQLTLEKTWRF